jgi:hypothetical protein
MEIKPGPSRATHRVRANISRMDVSLPIVLLPGKYSDSTDLIIACFPAYVNG